MADISSWNIHGTSYNLADATARAAVAGKQDAPATAGTAGQVLGLDESLDPVWINQTGGDVSGKADKVSGATNGNFAALDSNGNLTDSGHKHSDYLTPQDISGKQTAPETAGTAGQVLGLDSNLSPVWLDVPDSIEEGGAWA